MRATARGRKGCACVGKQKGRPEGRPFPYAKAQNRQNLLISRCSAWMRRTVPVTER